MLEVFPSARKCVYGFAMHSSTKKIKKREKSEKNTESIGGSAVASVLFLGVCGCVLLFVGFWKHDGTSLPYVMEAKKNPSSV